MVASSSGQSRVKSGSEGEGGLSEVPSCRQCSAKCPYQDTASGLLWKASLARYALNSVLWLDTRSTSKYATQASHITKVLEALALEVESLACHTAVPAYLEHYSRVHTRSATHEVAPIEGSTAQAEGTSMNKSQHRVVVWHSLRLKH